MLIGMIKRKIGKRVETSDKRVRKLIESVRQKILEYSICDN